MNASLYYVPADGLGSPTTLYTSTWGVLSTAESYVVAAGGALYWVDFNFSASPALVDIHGIAAP
jgi:hypothetical protein